MTTSLAAWRTRVEGQLIGSGECFALWQDYCINVVGAPASISSQQNTAHPGYAIAVWDGYDTNGAAQFFDRIPWSSPARAGDVAFWHYGTPFTPYSHVAIVLGDLGVVLDTESQNSPQRWAKHQTLTKAGVAGYFRPRNISAPPGTALASNNAAPASGSVLDTLGALSGHLSDPKFWTRIGLFALGAALAVLVLVHLFAPHLLPAT